MTPPALQITLLGPPRISWAGEPLLLPRRQARALLYHLAAVPQPVPRDRLCFLLWPDVSDATARRSLTVVLNHIRRALPLGDTLTVEGDAVGLDRLRLWTDVAVLGDVTTRATRERHLDRLSEATRLYRGPFLDGFTLPEAEEYEVWVEAERQTWERRFLEALAFLVEGYAEQGDYRAAIGTAQRYLATDELAEEMHRRLIALYLASGDRAAAIRQFERCAAVLQAELGSAPLPETRALYEAARDGARPISLARRGASIAARDAHTPARGAAGASTAPAHPAAPSTATASPEAPTTSGCLPVPPEPLVGRATELALTLDLLRRADVRLVTLCGPGGSGKTRLALEVGAAAQPGFAGDVAFVPLAPVRDPVLVLDAIARACGVREAGGESLMDVLRRRLRDRRLLLVLDNFEHLLPAAPLVAELLAGTPQLCVLVTSRAPLHLRGEHTVEVPPLPLPSLEPLPPLDALAAEPAVALLIARTRAHDPHFRLLEENARAVAEVCVRLEGLPLAIELAAARLRLLSPGALLERLEHRLALLTGGARDLPDRHRTLRATVAWSHRLLDAEAQLVFERLAVFDGGWDIAAAEAVCGATGEAASSVVDSLQALLEAHLIHRTTGPDGEPRFGMLETIREYARERLEASGDAAGAARAHALHYLALAEEARNRLQGSEQQRWFNRLAAEHENVRAALRWASAAGRADVVARIGGSILHFWYVRGHLAEGRSWLEAVLAARKGVPLPALARAAYGAGLLALRQGDAERAGAWYGEAYALYDRLGDAMGLAQAATGLGQTALHACRFADAQRHFHRSVELHRAHGHQDSATLTRSWLAAPSMYQGDHRTAITALEEAIAVHQRRGDTWNEGATLARLGQAHLAEGDLAQARRDFTAALRLMRPFEPREGLAWVLEGMGAAAAGAKDAAGAAHLFGAAEALRDAVGVPQPPHFRRFYAPFLAAARAGLQHEAFQAAWDAGRAHPLPQLVDELTAPSLEVLRRPAVRLPSLVA